MSVTQTQTHTDTDTGTDIHSQTQTQARTAFASSGCALKSDAAACETVESCTLKKTGSSNFDGMSGTATSTVKSSPDSGSEAIEEPRDVGVLASSRRGLSGEPDVLWAKIWTRT